MKYLRLEISSPRVYLVPAEVIAKSYAKFYSEKREDLTYEEEYENVMNSDRELLDWADSDMHWEDVAEFAEEIDPESDADMDDVWLDGEKSIIEK